MVQSTISASSIDSEQIRVCLLNTASSPGHGTDLQALLQPLEDSSKQIKLQRIDVSASRQLSKSVLAMISQLDPHIFLLSLHEHPLKQAEKWIRSVTECTQRPVVVILKAGEPEELVKLLKLGVSDFIVPPLRMIDVLPRLWRLVERPDPDDRLFEKLKARIGLGQMVGQDPVFMAEIDKIPMVATCDASVLILGETGTGKELCARAIHYLSHRSAKPFVPVNCGAIPSELVENELFGHVRGAFTGAFEASSGLISAAHGGTLFLDEIDCLPLPSQSKLMRFLQDKEYRQLGATRLRKADVRFVAASNQDLSKAVSDGRFRSDLYYRINVIPFHLPRLKDRRRDIVLLAEHFLTHYVHEYDKSVEAFSPQALQKLLLHDWPGNVRELENVVQRAVIFARDTAIRSEDIVLAGNGRSIEDLKSFQEMKAVVVAEFEKRYIQDLLQSHRGNISRAAQVARKNRRSFWELIRKHQIDVNQYKTGVPDKTG